MLRNHSPWRARVSAAHTIPRELRAMNEYAADWDRVRTITIPVLLIVGQMTEPRRKELFESIAGRLCDARGADLSGQRHAAHQTAPDLLASALRDFLLQVMGLPEASGPRYGCALDERAPSGPHSLVARARLAVGAG